ncbi:MAG TPA: pyridoxal phosphate-dependent aminotransferase [Thermoplasmata archaeon]|nr:pyridoxal phosphate-dependent aminotransferase [Thermoplasmata archaeon]
MSVSAEQKKKLHLSHLIEQELRGLSPIQTIMKIAEAQAIHDMGLDPENIISFGGGWCNHTAPEALRNAYQMILNDARLFHQSGRYSPIIGDSSCREQLCRFEETIYGLNSLERNNILLGHSSTQLFHDVLRAVCDPGEPIGFLDPTYANYLNAVKCALPGSPIRFIPALDPRTWTYLPAPDTSLEILKQHCEKGLRVFVIPVPDNPTSQIPSEEFLTSALDIVSDANGYLLLDFAYKALWFRKMPRCYSWSPQEHPHLITLHSNSKWLSSLGRRFGWVEAHETVINGLEKINESILLSPDSLHSMTTTRFLEQTLADGSLKQYVNDTRSLYQKTAAVMMSAIDSQLGWKRLTPAGGLYTCCPTPHQMQLQGFVKRLLKTTGVLLIPGTGFGPSMRYGLRLSYGPLCYEHEKIIEGIERISNYLAKTP